MNEIKSIIKFGDNQTTAAKKIDADEMDIFDLMKVIDHSIMLLGFTQETIDAYIIEKYQQINQKDNN